MLVRRSDFISKPIGRRSTIVRVSVSVSVAEWSGRVKELAPPEVIHQDVTPLDVAVDNPVAVEVSKPRQNLPRVVSNHGLVEPT